MTAPARPLPPLVVAAALALGTAVSLGLARFSYALFLPPMRADLGWSYVTSGAMNTANAVGYLAGALLAPVWLRRLGARGAFVVATAATAAMLAAHGVVASDPPLFALRFGAGLFSAVAFVAGGLLAAQQVGIESGRGESRSTGLVLAIYYAGAGLGIVVSSLLVPPISARVAAHAWQGAWLALGAVGGVAAALIAAATRPTPASASSAPTGATHATGAAGGTGATRATSDAASPAAVVAAAANAFDWRLFVPALVAYLCFGLGYIGYMTFIVTLLREQRLSGELVVAFFIVLGLAVAVSPWLWARMLQRYRGGETLCLLSAVLVVATLLPVVSAAPVAVFASGLLFGGVLLSLVASTTALVRHNVAPAGWPAGITLFTIVFAAGQIVGPILVGVVADRAGGLRPGLACSAALLAICSVVAWRQKPVAR